MLNPSFLHFHHSNYTGIDTLCARLNWNISKNFLPIIIQLKEKLPQAFMQIGWMEDEFRNLTAKVWANLDNPIKRYDFSKVSLISCMSPSQVALFYYLWCHNRQYNCLMELYTNFYKILLLWKCIFPLLFYLGMLGLRWMCMYLWMNLIKRTIDIQEKINVLKICVQSQWRVVTYSGRVPSREGDIHNFA